MNNHKYISCSVAVVIINWESYDEVKSCIESLKRSALPFYRIIVVDNGSKDGSAERLEQELKSDEQIALLRNPTNLGFAAGMNVGIRYALSMNCDYVFILNNDASIDPNCVKILVAESERLQAGIAGPRIFYTDYANKIWQGGGYFSYFKAGVLNPEKNKFLPVKTNGPVVVDFVTGCAMLVSTEVFKKLGLYDEAYFFYTEDLDFCLKAGREHVKVLFVPEAQAYHDIKGINKSRTSPYVLYHLARSTVILFRKNFGVLYFVYAVSLHFLLYTPYRLLQSLLGGNGIKGWFAWLRGTFAGLLSNGLDQK